MQKLRVGSESGHFREGEAPGGRGPGRARLRPSPFLSTPRPGEVRQLLGGANSAARPKPLAELADQRLAALGPALGARDGRPAVRHRIVLPSPAMAGIPIEAMLEARPAGAPRHLVSYAPSGTRFAWLRERRPGIRASRPSLAACWPWATRCPPRPRAERAEPRASRSWPAGPSISRRKPPAMEIIPTE